MDGLRTYLSIAELATMPDTSGDLCVQTGVTDEGDAIHIIDNMKRVDIRPTEIGWAMDGLYLRFANQEDHSFFLVSFSGEVIAKH